MFFRKRKLRRYIASYYGLPLNRIQFRGANVFRQHLPPPQRHWIFSGTVKGFEKIMNSDNTH